MREASRVPHMRQNGLEDVVPCDDAAVPHVAAIACALKRVARAVLDEHPAPRAKRVELTGREHVRLVILVRWRPKLTAAEGRLHAAAAVDRFDAQPSSLQMKYPAPRRGRLVQVVASCAAVQTLGSVPVHVCGGKEHEAHILNRADRWGQNHGNKNKRPRAHLQRDRSPTRKKLACPKRCSRPLMVHFSKLTHGGQQWPYKLDFRQYRDAWLCSAALCLDTPPAALSATLPVSRVSSWCRCPLRLPTQS